MLQFFAKRKYLVDYLNNFVDIHNHILPGIDDGAKTVEDSIALIKGFGEFGVCRFIATPHIMHNYYDNDVSSINSSLDQLRNVLLEKDFKNVSIEAAAEHMIDDNFEVLLSENRVMAMRREYLLVEMSYLQSSLNFDDAISKTMKHGLFPILAHPERYAYLHRDFKKYEKYKKEGILFQLNLLSLGDYYSPEVRKTAQWLLQNGHIDFVASDAHHMHHIERLKEIQLTEKQIDLLLPVIESTIETFY